MSLKELLEGLANLWKNSWAEIFSMENKWKKEDPRVLLSVVVGILTAVVSGIVMRKNKKERVIG